MWSGGVAAYDAEKQSNPGASGGHLSLKCSAMGSVQDNVTWERDRRCAMNWAIGARLDSEYGQKNRKQSTSRKRTENKLCKCTV